MRRARVFLLGDRVVAGALESSFAVGAAAFHSGGRRGSSVVLRASCGPGLQFAEQRALFKVASKTRSKDGSALRLAVRSRSPSGAYGLTKPSKRECSLVAGL